VSFYFTLPSRNIQWLARSARISRGREENSPSKRKTGSTHGRKNELGLQAGRTGWLPMTPLTIFGLFAVTAMLVCYALEARSRWFILAFAGACVMGSIYGFLQGAWPFGLVEAVWSVVAIRRWAKASGSK